MTLDIDLLFTVVKPSDWRSISEEGIIEPGRDNEGGYIRSFQGKEAEKIVNHFYQDEDSVMLLVLDPLRIQEPIKHIKEGELSLVAIKGSISIDTIIDKITLKKDKDGKFSVQVKHFD